MGAFSKLFIFSFSLVGIFALLFTLIPGGFFEASYDPSIGPDKEIAERFDIANVTMYDQTGNDNMTYDYSSYHDHTTDPPQFSAGLPTNQYLEVWWGFETGFIEGAKAIELIHVEEVWWGLHVHDWCSFEGVSVGTQDWMLFREDIVNSYDSEFNGSFFYASCTHVATSIILEYNQSKYADIGLAFDGGELSYSLSYEMDWNATGMSAWTTIGRLLTFQNPDLGISGDGGVILNYMIAIPLWMCIGLLILFIALAIIPFIPGLKD